MLIKTQQETAENNNNQNIGCAVLMMCVMVGFICYKMGKYDGINSINIDKAYTYIEDNLEEYGYYLDDKMLADFKSCKDNKQPMKEYYFYLDYGLDTQLVKNRYNDNARLKLKNVDISKEEAPFFYEKPLFPIKNGSKGITND